MLIELFAALASDPGGPAGGVTISGALVYAALLGLIGAVVGAWALVRAGYERQDRMRLEAIKERDDRIKALEIRLERKDERDEEQRRLDIRSREAMELSVQVAAKQMDMIDTRLVRIDQQLDEAKATAALKRDKP